jgi:hypothetical protein
MLMQTCTEVEHTLKYIICYFLYFIGLDLHLSYSCGSLVFVATKLIAL